VTDFVITFINLQVSYEWKVPLLDEYLPAVRVRCTVELVHCIAVVNEYFAHEHIFVAFLITVSSVHRVR
jgi:hypothetical protein